MVGRIIFFITNFYTSKTMNIFHKKFLTKLGIACLLAWACVSCQENDLAFDIIESPVLATFEMLDSDDATLAVKATFFDLDKSGILDQSIGIDSTRISGLPIEVFINESTLVESFVTDSNGEVVFEEPVSDLLGTGRLEWTGTFDGTPFRIYQNF